MTSTNRTKPTDKMTKQKEKANTYNMLMEAMQLLMYRKHSHNDETGNGHEVKQFERKDYIKQVGERGTKRHQSAGSLKARDYPLYSSAS